MIKLSFPLMIIPSGHPSASVSTTSHLDFTNQNQPSAFLDNIPLPVTNAVKYLGSYIDRRLTWNPNKGTGLISLHFHSTFMRLTSRLNCRVVINKMADVYLVEGYRPRVEV
jgi:hypothetical protein